MNDAIRSELNSGEMICWSKSGDFVAFEMVGQSTIGKHIVSLTNRGRLIMHDEGGFFGKKQTFVWSLRTYPLRIVSEKSNTSYLQISSVYSSNYNVSFAVSFWEYVLFIKELSVDCFDQSPTLMPICIQHESSTYKVDIAQHIDLLDLQYYEPGSITHSIQIKYSNVRYCDFVTTNTLCFKGNFSRYDLGLEEITIFSPDQQLLMKLQSNATQTQTIYDVLGQDAIPYHVDSLQVNGQQFTRPMIVGVQGQILRVVSEQDLTILKEIQLQTANAYFDRESKTVLFETADSITIMKISDSPALDFAAKQFGETDRHMSIVALELKLGGNEKIDAYLVSDKQKAFVIDSLKGNIVAQIDFKMDECFFDREQHRFFIIKPDRSVHKMVVKRTDTRSHLLKHFETYLGALFCNEGNLNGYFADTLYEKQQVDLLLSNQGIRFLHLEDNSLTVEVPFAEIQIIADFQKVFYVHRKQISILSGTRRYVQLIQQKIETAHDEPLRIGYTQFEMPARIEQDSTHLRLMQTQSISLFEWAYHEIRKIKVVERHESSEFIRLSINLIDDQEIFLHVHSSMVEELIYHTYYGSKASLVPQVSTSQMLLSWGRSMNDYVLYQSFGTLFALYGGAKEIAASSESKEQKNLQLVNALYYGLQTQKQRLDLLSIYMPSFFEQEDQVMIRDLGVNLSEQPYRKLRSSLMSTFNHMSRYLNEMDYAMSSVSFAIIPRENALGVHKEKAKRGMKLSALGGVAAVTLGTIGTGGLGLFFAVPSLIQVVNAHYGAKDAAELEKIREANEQHRLDFIVAKVLNTFQHFMESMVPYFVSEINRATYQYYIDTSSTMQGVVDQNQLKLRLLDNLTKHFTFKQLPIDDSVLLSKQELTEIIHSNMQKTEDYIHQFRMEVGRNV